MSARNSAKAIIVHNGKILVNRCQSRFGEYYSLPGGGQKTGETLSDALKREVLEETGYSIEPMRLSGIYERVSENRDEEQAHKIYFIFRCKLSDDSCIEPCERDRFQIGCEWIPAEELPGKSLFPKAIRDNLAVLTGYGETYFIGSEKDRF